MISELEKVVSEMKAEFNVFLENCDQKKNKAASARARKSSMAIRKLGKRFRKLSVEADK